jgi:hypothetical protein
MLPFPYDYFNCFEKLNTDISKITIKDFHNKLNKSVCSEEDFKLYNSIIKAFKIKTAKDFLYLNSVSDVLLLEDVCENYIKTELKTFKLDPSYYISLASLCWDIVLKLSKVELE